MQSEVRWAAKLDIKLVPAGEMLSPKDNMDALAATCAAVRSATNEVGFYHSRQQLLVFDENDEDEDTARRYAAALAREMCSPHPVTQVNLPASKKQVEEAVPAPPTLGIDPTCCDSATQAGAGNGTWSKPIARDCTLVSSTRCRLGKPVMMCRPDLAHRPLGASSRANLCPTL